MDEAEYCNRIALINRGTLVALGSPAQLRQHSLGGTLLRVQCTPLSRALEVMKGFSAARDVAVFGNAMHVLVDDAAASSGPLAGFLGDNGVSEVQVSRINPSLEDTFVHLIGLQTQAAGAGA
jgi:ABC-2 type transport system ATP-binding protein